VSTEVITALGAFLSGAGSVIGAMFALRHQRKQDEEDCEKRFKAFREGLGLRLEEDDDENK